MNFGRVAKIFVDAKANEAYIADGYLNKRVAVIDADSGKMKRYWGAYGNKPDDTPLGRYNPAAPPAKQFRNPVHCADLSNDGLLYVCDRVNDRIQVFTPGRQVRQGSVLAKNTLAPARSGTSRSRRIRSRRYIYLADGVNDKVHILDRQTLQDADQLRRRRPSAGPVLRRAQHRRPTRRATSTRPRPTKESGSRSSCTRASPR